MMSKGLVHEDLVGDFKLEVFYETENRTFEVNVKDTKSDKNLTESFVALYEPVFGIDVSDFNQILEIAEKLAIQLES